MGKVPQTVRDGPLSCGASKLQEPVHSSRPQPAARAGKTPDLQLSYLCCQVIAILVDVARLPWESKDKGRQNGCEPVAMTVCVSCCMAAATFPVQRDSTNAS
jgi:hypothetical protein